MREPGTTAVRASAARERLAAAQGELMRALSSLGPVPAGFDAAGVREEAATLLRKRRKLVAKARPALVRVLGTCFRRELDAYAAEHPSAGHACADGAGFARWIHERLEDERFLESLEWRVGLRAVLTAQSRKPLAAETRADLEQFQTLVAEVMARRGPLALEEPRLKATLAIASLEALGLELDPAQVTGLRAVLVAGLDRLARVEDEDSTETTLDTALASLRASLVVESALSAILTHEQRELYRARTGDDPFVGRDVPRVRIVGPTSVAQALVGIWSRRFSLGESALGASREIAERFARAVAALPGPLDAGTRRVAIVRRAAAVLALQRKAEEQLARSLALSDAERRRVVRGRGALLLELVG
jgi:hypothetical protein